MLVKPRDSGGIQDEKVNPDMNIYQAKIRLMPGSSQLDIFSFGGIVSSPRKTAYCGFTTVRTMPDTQSGVQAASSSRVKSKTLNPRISLLATLEDRSCRPGTLTIAEAETL